MTRDPLPDLSRATVISLVYFGCFSLSLFMCTPAYVLLMVREWHFSEASAGIVVSASVLGNTLGGLVVGSRAWRLGGRTTLFAAALTMVGGYGIAAFGASAPQVGAEVFVAGLGSGILSGVSTRSLAYSRHPHRYLSMVAMAQNICAAVLMGVALPFVGEHWGVLGAYLLIASLVVPCLFMIGATHAEVRRETAPAGHAAVNRRGVAALLVSQLAYYVLIGVVWTFLGTLGTENGLRAEDVDRAAGASNLLALGVCVLSPWLERSGRMRAWSIWSILFTLVGLVGMVLTHRMLGFAAWMLVMNAGWTLNGIVLQCLFPGVDPAGRFVGVTSGLTGIGFSTGAWLGGSALQTHAASSTFLWALGLGVLAAAVLMLVRTPAAPMPDTAEADAAGFCLRR
jgi:predicted MFS family arabinose efflux permease